MIDWNKIDYNKELNIELIEGKNVVTLTAALVDYEWSPHRVPAIANVKILNTGDVIKLPIITKDIDEPFIVLCPRPIKPCNQLRLKAKVVLN